MDAQHVIDMIMKLNPDRYEAKETKHLSLIFENWALVEPQMDVINAMGVVNHLTLAIRSRTYDEARSIIDLLFMLTQVPFPQSAAAFATELGTESGLGRDREQKLIYINALVHVHRVTDIVQVLEDAKKAPLYKRKQALERTLVDIGLFFQSNVQIESQWTYDIWNDIYDAILTIRDRTCILFLSGTSLSVIETLCDYLDAIGQ